MFSNLLFKFDNFSIPEIFARYSVQELYQLSHDKDLLPNILSMVNWLDNLRTFYGKPIRLTSSFRNPEHNSRVGGSPTSQHKEGLALDIQPFCNSAVPSKAVMIEFVDKTLAYVKQTDMIGQIIIHPNYIHVGALTENHPFSIRVIDFPEVYELFKSNNYSIV